MVRESLWSESGEGPEERDREDLLSGTPPIELMRFMLCRHVARRPDGLERKTVYLGSKKAHLAPNCDQDFYV